MCRVFLSAAIAAGWTNFGWFRSSGSMQQTTPTGPATAHGAAIAPLKAVLAVKRSTDNWGGVLLFHRKTQVRWINPSHAKPSRMAHSLLP